MTADISRWLGTLVTSNFSLSRKNVGKHSPISYVVHEMYLCLFFCHIHIHSCTPSKVTYIHWLGQTPYILRWGGKINHLLIILPWNKLSFSLTQKNPLNMLKDPHSLTKTSFRLQRQKGYSPQNLQTRGKQHPESRIAYMGGPLEPQLHTKATSHSV